MSSTASDDIAIKEELIQKLGMPADLVKELLSSDSTKDEAYWKQAAEKYAPAIVQQREYLLDGSTTSADVQKKAEWKNLLHRRLQDRMEAIDTWKRYHRQQAEEKANLKLPGPVDPNCHDKPDSAKYGFYIETDAMLSDDVDTQCFFVTDCKAATSDGDFVLYLDIPNFFSKDLDPMDTFQQYFDREEYVQYCEGVKHFVCSPSPIRVYVTHKATGLQADLFDENISRVWCHPEFSEYDDETILPMLIRVELEDDGENADDCHLNLLHLYNRCERLEMHGGKGYGTMGIALFRRGEKLCIRVKAEGFDNKSVGDFFRRKVEVSLDRYEDEVGTVRPMMLKRFIGSYFRR